MGPSRLAQSKKKRIPKPKCVMGDTIVMREDRYNGRVIQVKILSAILEEKGGFIWDREFKETRWTYFIEKIPQDTERLYHPICEKDIIHNLGQ